MINWNATDEDRILIDAIVSRVASDQDYISKSRIDNLTMTISACHLNGTPLDLEKLLKAPEFDFYHDIVGIEDHMNTKTGQIERHFLPRCSKRGEE